MSAEPKKTWEELMDGRPKPVQVTRKNGSTGFNCPRDGSPLDLGHAGAPSGGKSLFYACSQCTYCYVTE